MYQMTICGKSVDGRGNLLHVYNPVTGKILADYRAASPSQCEESLKAAQQAFPLWSSLSIEQREKYILEFASRLEEERESIIELLILETGKPRENAEYDFDMLPNCLRFYIEEMKRLYGRIIPDYSGDHLNLTIYTPLGVVVGYLAWNFPLLNLGYKLGPVLASGCTCVLKPSSETPLSALRVGEIIRECLPAGVANIVAGPSRELAPVMNSSTIPKLITLIGSSSTGRNIIRESATSIKHYSLELGGNAPAVVMNDADIESAALCITDGKFSNAGQVCVAPNRIFVHQDILREFTAAIMKHTKNISLESCSGQIQMGPLSSERAVKNMEFLVKDALDKGAVLAFGGKRKQPGYYFEPTVLTNVTKKMRVYTEEIFGPILPIISFSDQEDICTLANDTEYGLTAYLYTSSLSTAMQFSKNIIAGSICINEPYYHYNLPHGGLKESGIGKDCSAYSLEDYLSIKRISAKF